MDIVSKVAEDISAIPGDASPEVIARVAIEAYQREIWAPAFSSRMTAVFPELRRTRAHQLTAHIMSIVAPHLCDHGERHSARNVSRALFEAVYESGAEVITDADRAVAGLPARGPHGLTADELHIIEARRIQTMLAPMPPFLMPCVGDRTEGSTAQPVA